MQRKCNSFNILKITLWTTANPINEVNYLESFQNSKINVPDIDVFSSLVGESGTHLQQTGKCANIKIIQKKRHKIPPCNIEIFLADLTHTYRSEFALALGLVRFPRIVKKFCSEI